MKYRLLKVGEIIKENDEVKLGGDKWEKDTGVGYPQTGKILTIYHYPYRRPIKSTSRTSTNSRLRKCPHCHHVIRRALPKAADVVGNLIAQTNKVPFGTEGER